MTRAWNGDRAFVVERRVAETAAVTSFYRVPEHGEPLPAFAPGQFLTLTLDIPGQPGPVTRTYTLSDAPNAEHYRLSIKRESPPAHRPEAPAGLSSSYFHDQVQLGTRLRARAARGALRLDPNEQTPVVLVSAGMGLTPMISMLNAIVAAGSERPVWFIHGARNGREHVMGEHVRRLAAAHHNVRLHVRYSRPEPADIMGQGHDGVGHVTVDVSKALLPPAPSDDLVVLG